MNTKFDTLPADRLEDATRDINALMDMFGRQKMTAPLADGLAQWGVRRCSKCLCVKHLEGFPKNLRNRDGLASQCKTCTRADSADYRKRNPEYMREYNAANPEYMRDYYAANRDQLIEYQHTKYHNDEIYRLSLQLNSGYRRAIAAGNPAEKLTPEDLLSHWEQQGIPALECYLTEEALSPQTRSIDHVLAIANGGGHVLSNLMPSTWTANQKKRDLSPEDALEILNNEQETITND